MLMPVIENVLVCFIKPFVLMAYDANFLAY